MNNRRAAVITGWSLILMTFIAGFSVGYAFPELYRADQTDLLKENILNNPELYRNMLAGILVILILDFLVSYTLYLFFKNDNKRISLAAGLVRFIYTLLFGLATFQLAGDMNKLSNEMIIAGFQSFEFIWNIGLFIFGFHILLIGFLMKLHQTAPKILCYLIFFAGASYLIVHLLKLTQPGSDFVMNLEMVLALPMAVGEFGLAVWLLIKGGKKLTD